MKHILLVFLLFSIAHLASAQQSYLYQKDLCSLDSIDMPIFFVDGVEINNLDSISIDDVISINVIKDAKILKYFRPRMGALIFITTKSRKYLTPILIDYEKKLNEWRDSLHERKDLIR